jgi:hypothetical protein
LPGGQNNLAAEAIENVKVDGTTVTFEAAFQFQKGTFGTATPFGPG